ncbi:MAG: hypothetical protein AAFR74_06410 [Pseudomonadota bacterium]
MFGRPKIRCRYSSVEKLFCEIGPEQQFNAFIQALEAFTPFWKTAISVCGQATETPKEKQDKLQRFVDSAPELLRAWSSNELKVVQARKKEVWSATSFVWRSALKKEVCSLKLAPVFRNLHSVLASTIKVCTGEYHKDYAPELLFSLSYNIAFVQTLFEYDNADLMQFSHMINQVNLTDRDHVIEIYKTAAIQLKARRSMQRVFNQVPVVIDNLGSLEEFQVDPKLWGQRSNADWYTLKQDAFASFHGKPSLKLPR